MKTKKINEDRLRHYADYLKHGNIRCTEYYGKLTRLHVGKKVKEDESLQPVYFLPIMELPMIFTNDWYYDENYLPVYEYNADKETISSVMQYFGLNKTLFCHLFVKGKQRTEIWGGSELSVKPTLPELASNIEDLIEHLQYYANINGNDLQIFLN